MTSSTFSLKDAISLVAKRFNSLIPILLQMGIIEELLHKKFILSETGGESYTITITPEGMSLEDGKSAFSHAKLCTTSEQWTKIFAGKKTYATIFRFEFEPKRDLVPINEMALTERFSTILQAMVSLPL